MLSSLIILYGSVRTLAHKRELGRVGENLCRFARAVWLFTRSDLKTIVGPSTLYGITTALSVSLRQSRQDDFTSDSKNVEPLIKLPLVLLWVWINLLPFAIDNQRSTEAIREDRINKPWRPMPSGMLSRREAKITMFLGYSLALLTSYFLGGLAQCITLVGLGMWYNNFGGADVSSAVRNLINACGYFCFITGAYTVASRSSERRMDSAVQGVQWPLVIAAIVLSTVHIQDLSDQEGDRARGRKTLPLQLGDATARHLICLLIPSWSCACLCFWPLSIAYRAGLCALAAGIAFRVEFFRRVEEDKTTFKLWNLWISNVYLLPLLSTLATPQTQAWAQ